MIKHLLMIIMVVITVGLGVGLLSPTPASALTDDDCQTSFLTFRPWYYNLVKAQGDKCVIKTPQGDGEVAGFVWAIVLNILNILFNLVGYLALGFIVYGGYLYVLARGDPGRIAKGKRTVISAVVGLIICILASLIVSTIVGVITEAMGI
ncbi:pilin [Candidatus Saccharibacteria bacterium]|nr:pilin [Candidatus Saccharibacteria bacterium]